MRKKKECFAFNNSCTLPRNFTGKKYKNTIGKRVFQCVFSKDICTGLKNRKDFYIPQLFQN